MITSFQVFIIEEPSANCVTWWLKVGT